MRYLEAGTLKARMSKEPLSLSEINRVVGQVGSALDYAHRMGVVHRDVKPANVLLDAEGDAFLTDFGLAKIMSGSARLTGTGVGIGTPVYMSPEQGQAQKVDARSDVYSLGVMLYELATGRVPYEAETPLAVVLKHIQEPLPLPSSVRPNLPERIERVILRAMAKEPEDRYQTAGEMVRALDGAVRAAEAAVRTEPAIERTTPMPGAVRAVPQAKARRLRLPRWVGWAAGGAVALAAFFFILSRVPLRVEISGGQLEVVRVVEETPVEAAATPTSQPAAIPTHTPEPVPAAGTSVPLEQGEILGYLNNDVCIFDSQGMSTLTGLAETFIDFNGLSWSPDGSRLVFSANRKDDDAADPKNDLYIANRDGSNVTALARNPDSFLFFPAWSPNGEWIAFHDNSAVAVIRPDGTDENTLVQGGNTCPQAVAWSPDSQSIAWVGELGFCETGKSRDVWVINRDGSGMNNIFHSSEQELENQIAWSPDGESVAVLTTDGVAYLVDADCSDQPNGCDESSRTEIATFPNHWLHTFYPQWGGEAAAAPTPAEQARAFADPILAAIADRPPDYEDDFSDPASGWSQGAIVDLTGWEEGERGYADGEYYIVAPPAKLRPQMPERPMTCASGWPADLGALSDMVLEVEGRFVEVENGNRHVNFRQWDDPDTGLGGKYEVMFEPNGNVWIGKVHPTEGHQVLAEMQGLPVQAGLETNRLRIVTVGPRIAVYVNGEPVLFFADPDFDERYQSGPVSLVACNSADTPMEVRWDSLKVWDISGLELPSAEATPAAEQAHAFAAPILVAIADRAPDFEDDFGNQASGWYIGSSDECECGYEDGALSISVKHPTPPGTPTCESRSNRAPAFSDFALEVDVRAVSGVEGKWAILIRDSPSRHHIVEFEPTKDEFQWIRVLDGVPTTLAQEMGVSAFNVGYETNHLQIIAQGPRIAVYANGEPVWFVYDESLRVGEIALRAGIFDVSTSAPFHVHFDNLRVWDISDLELPAPADADLWCDVGCWLQGPAGDLASRNPHTSFDAIVQGQNAVRDVAQIAIESPNGETIVLTPYGDIYGQEGRFAGLTPGLPQAEGTYTFTALDANGTPIPGMVTSNVYIGGYEPDPPNNIQAEVVETGILVTWDPSPVIPGAFEPNGSPPLGWYSILLTQEEGELVYGWEHEHRPLPETTYLIPFRRQDFGPSDTGLALKEMEDGVYYLELHAFSVAPEGTAGHYVECIAHDPAQNIRIVIEGGQVRIEGP